METYPRFAPPACIASNNLDEENANEVSDNIDQTLPPKPLYVSSKQVGVGALDQQLKSAFHRLHKLTDILNTNHATVHLKLEDISYSDEVYLVQREFLSIIRFFGENRGCGHSSCSIAGMIFVECCLRDVSTSSRIVCDLVARVVVSLEDSERGPRHQAEGGILDLLIFWVLFVGAAATERNTAVREKLVKWLVFVCRRLMQEPWTKTEETLKRISWVERGGRLFGAPLWEEITQSHFAHG